MKQRNKKIDFLKGILIILVVMGHTIQYGMGEAYFNQQSFFENRIFQFIYGFHMPLFMLVSGMLFRTDKTIKETFLRKCKQLLIPMVVWSSIIFLVQNHFQISMTYTTLCIYFNYLFNYLWYLVALFFSCMIVSIVEKQESGKWLGYLVLFLIFLLTKDEIVINLAKMETNAISTIIFSSFKYNFWFFLIGFYRKDQIKKPIERGKFLLGGGGVLLYLILIYFWKVDYYIYTTGFTLVEKDIVLQLGNHFYRFTTSILGCSIMIGFAKRIPARFEESWWYQFICYIGERTLGIYTISCLLFYSVLYPMTMNRTGFSMIPLLWQTIVMLLVCLIATNCINHTKYIKKMLLGR